MESTDIELLTNNEIPEVIRSAIATKIIETSDRQADRDLEADRLKLERERLALEDAVKARELTLKEKQHGERSISAAQATIAGALLALVSGVIGAGITAWTDRGIAEETNLALVQVEQTKVDGSLALQASQQNATERLERLEFESQLILSAIEGGSRSEAIRNLRFFLAAGFISDPDGKIASLSDDALPSKTEPSEDDVEIAASATVKIIDPTDQSLLCNAVAISVDHFLTVPHCVEHALEVAGRVVISGDGSGEQDLLNVDVSVVQTFEDSQVVVLSAQGILEAEFYFPWDLVRAPEAGEEVYLVAWTPQLSERLFLRCQITSSGGRIDIGDQQITSVTHNCATVPGTSGSLIIAVRDNAPIGVNIGSLRSGVSIAAPLVQVKSEVSAFIQDTSLTSENSTTEEP